ncbi:Ubiquitin-conjugating enzyme [Gimesia alba]|uniref:Ubiquitin-conjugating enzyme n=1 Tax=Gimesia alba TaxID=2527973 RepID=A0A517RCS9_9PLAN|nr:ubiquitin-conjugating enzyme E2 [Gimesia alba]QDT41691.1 Ubiquitin-conjugating enzyme [Gimesia alba]
MSNVRLRRLAADYAKLKEYVRLHPRVSLLQVTGDPPEKFQLQYVIKSVRMQNQEVVPVKTHTVEISLPRNYPRTPPQCRMLSPVFHPNIAPHAICVGDHWSAGESLQSIIIRIGEILAYQSYNLKSPLNGEAARWAEQNSEEFPTDTVSLLPEEKSKKKQPVSRTKESNEKTQSQRILVCPSCQAKYRLPAEFQKRKVRCKKCEAIIEIPVV